MSIQQKQNIFDNILFLFQFLQDIVIHFVFTKFYVTNISVLQDMHEQAPAYMPECYCTLSWNFL